MQHTSKVGGNVDRLLEAEDHGGSPRITPALLPGEMALCGDQVSSGKIQEKMHS